MGHARGISDGRVLRATVSGALDPGLNPCRVKPVALNLILTAYLFDAQHYGGSVGNKPASLLVPLVKALRGIPPSEKGRQMAGNS